MKRRGFTIVELVITITVMVILLTLAVVNITSTQANARDSERKADAESIALNLENFYANQNPNIPNSGGSYPGLDGLSDLKTYLPDLDIKVTQTPGNNDSGSTNLVAATNNLSPSVTPLPSTTNDVYVYQPLTVSGSLCATTSTTSAGACRKFNIYYFQETSNRVEMITSKHQ